MDGPSSIDIFVRGEPVAWDRAGRAKGWSYTPAKQREAMRTLQWEARRVMALQKPLEGPLSATMIFEYNWPASMSKRLRTSPEGLWKKSRPDLDNLVKLVCDALNTIVWLDDAQIVLLTAIKRYGDIPSVSIIVGSTCYSSPIRSEEEVDAE